MSEIGGVCPTCAGDHCHPTDPRLLDLEVKSISPPQIFTRLIVRHEEIGLSQRQLHRILELYRRYRNDYSAVAAKARLSATDLLRAIYEFPIRRRKVQGLLKKHARIFIQHELLYANVIGSMRKTITAGQYDELCRIYVEERRQQLEPIESAIREALRPVFSVRRKAR